VRLFLDTANIDEIREAVSWGVISGVTTNPTLVAKEQGRDFADIVSEITAVVPGPVSVEAVSLEAPAMIEEARRIAAMAGNVVVKIPMTPEGLKAVKVLSGEGVRTNVTLIFSANQALRNAFLNQTEFRVHIPPISLCTDNAAMIAAAGYYRFAYGQTSSLDMDVQATWPLS